MFMLKSSLSITWGSAWTLRLLVFTILLSHLGLSFFELSIIILPSILFLLLLLLLLKCGVWLCSLGVPWLDISLLPWLSWSWRSSWWKLRSWRLWLIINLLRHSIILWNWISHRLSILCRFLLIKWLSQYLILSYRRSTERLRNRCHKFWLNQSLCDRLVCLLKHLKVMLVFIIFLSLLHVYSMLFLQFILMINDCLLSLQVVFMFLLHFSLMFFLSLPGELLLLLKVSRLISLFVMFNMFGVLFVLLLQISVNFFS